MKTCWVDIAVLSNIQRCFVPHSGTLLKYLLIKVGYESRDVVFSEAQCNSEVYCQIYQSQPGYGLNSFLSKCGGVKSHTALDQLMYIMTYLFSSWLPSFNF